MIDSNDPRLTLFKIKALQMGMAPELVDTFINEKIGKVNKEQYKEDLSTKTQEVNLMEKLKPTQTPEEKAIEAKELQDEYADRGLTPEGKKKEESESDKKIRIAKENADKILTQLEDMYSKGKLSKGRVGGLLGNILAIAGFAPELKTYQVTREAVKPTLARAAGDVGNLNIQEQEAAIKQIPTEYSTPEEANQQFEAARKRFGLPSRKKVKLEDIFK